MENWIPQRVGDAFEPVRGFRPSDPAWVVRPDSRPLSSWWRPFSFSTAAAFLVDLPACLPSRPRDIIEKEKQIIVSAKARSCRPPLAKSSTAARADPGTSCSPPLAPWICAGATAMVEPEHRPMLEVRRSLLHTSSSCLSKRVSGFLQAALTISNPRAMRELGGGRCFVARIGVNDYHMVLQILWLCRNSLMWITPLPPCVSLCHECRVSAGSHHNWSTILNDDA